MTNVSMAEMSMVDVQLLSTNVQMSMADIPWLVQMTNAIWSMSDSHMLSDEKAIKELF